MVVGSTKDLKPASLILVSRICAFNPHDAAGEGHAVRRRQRSRRPRELPQAIPAHAIL
jgi:hypothetical protein